MNWVTLLGAVQITTFIVVMAACVFAGLTNKEDR